MSSGPHGPILLISQLKSHLSQATFEAYQQYQSFNGLVHRSYMIEVLCSWQRQGRWHTQLTKNGCIGSSALMAIEPKTGR